MIPAAFMPVKQLVKVLLGSVIPQSIQHGFSVVPWSFWDRTRRQKRGLLQSFDAVSDLRESVYICFKCSFLFQDHKENNTLPLLRHTYNLALEGRQLKETEDGGFRSIQGSLGGSFDVLLGFLPPRFPRHTEKPFLYIFNSL